jgi:hypothetical protein
VRGTASSMESFWGRLFSIFSPLVAARVLEGSLDGPLFSMRWRAVIGVSGGAGLIGLWESRRRKEVR